MSKGYVYILTNPSMPGVVKIGKTTRTIEARAHELYQTGVPTPFKVNDSVFSPNCFELEQSVHGALSEYRVSPSREFFAIDPLDAFWVLEEYHKRQLEEWLDEYLPDHSIVSDYYKVDVGHINRLAEEVGAAPPSIPMVIEHLTGDEIRPAFNRYLKWVEERVAARLAEREAGSDG